MPTGSVSGPGAHNSGGHVSSAANFFVPEWHPDGHV